MFKIWNKQLEKVNTNLVSLQNKKNEEKEKLDKERRDFESKISEFNIKEQKHIEDHLLFLQDRIDLDALKKKVQKEEAKSKLRETSENKLIDQLKEELKESESKLSEISNKNSEVQIQNEELNSKLNILEKDLEEKVKNIGNLEDSINEKDKLIEILKKLKVIIKL